jgi:hypothetical protein
MQNIKVNAAVKRVNKGKNDKKYLKKYLLSVTHAKSIHTLGKTKDGVTNRYGKKPCYIIIHNNTGKKQCA